MNVIADTLKHSEILIKIFRNLIAGWGSTIVIGIIGFLMIPFLLGQMGGDGYAFVVVLLSINGIAQLADMGIGISLSRELTECRATGQHQLESEVMTAGLLLYALIGLLGATIVFMAAPLIVNKLWTGADESAIAACRVYGFGAIFIGFINQTWISLLTAHQRFDVSSSLIVGASICNALLIWILVPVSSEKIMTWAIIQVLVQFMLSVILIIAAKKVNGPLRIKVLRVSSASFRNIIGLSGKVSLLKLTTVLSEKADPLILSALTSPAGVVAYNSASKVSAATKPFVTTIAGQLCPRVTEVFSQGDEEEVKKILLVGTRYTMILGGLLCLLTVVFAGTFSKLWLGEALPDHWPMVAWLMIGIAVIDYATFAGGGTQWSILFGTKKLGFLVWTMLPTAFLNLGLSIWLVGWTDFGVKGVIISTIVISLLRRPIIVWYTSKLVGAKMSEYFIESYLRPLLIFVIVGLAAWASGVGSKVDSWFDLIAASSVISIIWVTLTWLLAVSQTEKQKLFNWLKRKGFWKE